MDAPPFRHRRCSPRRTGRRTPMPPRRAHTPEEASSTRRACSPSVRAGTRSAKERTASRPPQETPRTLRGVEPLEIIFSVVGTAALLLGGWSAVWRARMLLRWKRCRATVVTYSRHRAHRGSSFVKLTVRFPEDGDQVEGTDDGPWGHYRADEEVTVLLNPASDAHRVVVPEFLRFWMLSLIFRSVRGRIPLRRARVSARTTLEPGRGATWLARRRRPGDRCCRTSESRWEDRLRKDPARP